MEYRGFVCHVVTNYMHSVSVDAVYGQRDNVVLKMKLLSAWTLTIIESHAKHV